MNNELVMLGGGSYHYVNCDIVILHLHLPEGLVANQNNGVRLAGLHAGV